VKHRTLTNDLVRFVIPVLLTTLVGCQVGPGRLKSATSHYSDALRIVASEQLLVNLVRLRYRDLPVFLGVSSISTQFEFDTALDINGSALNGSGSSSVGIGGGVRFSERPTITFSPQAGEEFHKRMLRPLDVVGISLVAESGWRGDRLLRLTVEKMNGLHNAPRASGPTPAYAPRHADFVEAMTLLRKLSREGMIDFEYQTLRELLSAPLPLSQIDGEHTVSAVTAGVEFDLLPDGRVQLAAEKRVLVMRFRRGADDSPDAARLRSLLRLERGTRRFPIVAYEDSTFDPFDSDQRVGEVALDTRSLMGVLYYAANGIQVPEEHLDAHYATTTVDSDGAPFDWSDVLGGLFQVHCSDSLLRPSDAAVAVRYRGHWFYIEDGDEESKSTFTLLAQLYSLQAGEVSEEKPVLTLPVGGR
jgi:hypothetical protein